MSQHKEKEQWVHETWELLRQAPVKDVVDELKGQWLTHAQRTQPKLVVFGAFDAGKSSLLKRLLVESGVEVPSWLGVSGQRQTFKQDSISVAGLTLVDTPGISAGNDEHEEIALEALQLADAYLWVMPPQLMTGDRELVMSLMSGKIFSPSLPSHAVTTAAIAVVARMDEAVVSRNTITAECADIQSVEDPALGQISNRAPRFRTVRLRQWT